MGSIQFAMSENINDLVEDAIENHELNIRS